MLFLTERSVGPQGGSGVKPLRQSLLARWRVIHAMPVQRPHPVASNVKNAERIQNRRKQLVGAAVEVFVRKGFHNTTVRDIGAAAGLTQGTIYNYVRSKDDILYLVCEEVITAYQTAIRRAVENVSGPHRLEATIRATLEAMYDHQEHILLMYQEGHALDSSSLKAILAHVEGFNDFIAETLADCTAKTPLAVKNKALAINILTFVPAIVALRRWSLRGKAPRQELLNEMTAFIMRGLGIAHPTKSDRPC
jgi:AcrR family transcriptional regulator